MGNTILNAQTVVATTTQTNCRYQINYELTPGLKLHNRLELTYFHNDVLAVKQQGYLIYQDVNYKYKNSKFNFNLRYGLFDTDNYTTRIYAYENGLPGAYSLPSYYYKGMYYYFLLSYAVSAKITVWLRYSATIYSNKTVIDPGSLNEINGDTKSELKVFLRISF